MVIRDMLYSKEGQVKPYKVLMLKEKGDSFEGISLDNFTPDEVAKLMEAVKVYEQALGPYVKKGFRKFSLSNVVKLEENFTPRD